MSPRTAPCGHPGEPIIGAFVRCLQGCDGAIAPAARRTPGHVEACACSECDFRRRARTIIYRTKCGRDAVRAEWDGVAPRVDFVVRVASEPERKPLRLRHFRVEDGEGKTIASGTVDVELWNGFEGWADVRFLSDRLSLSVPAPAPDERVSRPRSPMRMMYESTVDIVRACRSVEGVKSVKVRHPEFDKVIVAVVQGRYFNLNDVMDAARDVTAAGVIVEVVDETPLALLRQAMRCMGTAAPGSNTIEELRKRLPEGSVARFGCFVDGRPAIIAVIRGETVFIRPASTSARRQVHHARDGRVESSATAPA